MAQAGEHESWRPQLSSGHDLVATVVRAWAREEAAESGHPTRTLGGILAHRALEVAARAAPTPTATGRVPDACRRLGRSGGRRGSCAVGPRIPPPPVRRPHDQLGARLRAVGDAELAQPVVHQTGADARVEVEHGPAGRAFRHRRSEKGPVRRIGRSVQWWEATPTGSPTIPWAPMAADGRARNARGSVRAPSSQSSTGSTRACTAIRKSSSSTLWAPACRARSWVGLSLPRRSWRRHPNLGRLAVDVLAATVDDGLLRARPSWGSAWRGCSTSGSARRRGWRAAFARCGRVSPLHGVQVVRAVESMLSHLRTGRAACTRRSSRC